MERRDGGSSSSVRRAFLVQTLCRRCQVRELAAAARPWQRDVQRLADEGGLSIDVHRSPPGTDKRNKIEPCLASFIRRNWPA
jgi:Rhodopirellula transposase DDE domain